jgi:hypothetical protein
MFPEYTPRKNGDIRQDVFQMSFLAHIDNAMVFILLRFASVASVLQQ